jgi:hypothetical protein
MSTISYILGILVAVAVLIIVVERLRRRRLRERHAVWWIVAGAFALVAGIFPSSLAWLSGLVGISLPINLVFFAGISTLFFVGLQHSAELTDMENELRVLAENSALQDLRIRELERIGHADKSDD